MTVFHLSYEFGLVFMIHIGFEYIVLLLILIVDDLVVEKSVKVPMSKVSADTAPLYSFF